MRKVLVLFLILSVLLVSCNKSSKYKNVFRAIDACDLEAVKDFVNKNPETAEKMHEQSHQQTHEKLSPDDDYCSMCGKAWCSVRINKDIREAVK